MFTTATNETTHESQQLDATERSLEDATGNATYVPSAQAYRSRELIFERFSVTTGLEAEVRPIDICSPSATNFDAV